VDEHPTHFGSPNELKARVHEVGAQFLLSELQAGLTLLNVADTSASDEDNERRRALALEAYQVVSDRLARAIGTTPLTDEERARITRLRQELGRRLGR
jgi:hypothetical protein